MINKILFYATLALAIWCADLLLAGLIANPVLRAIAAALCVTAAALVCGIGFYMMRAWLSRAR